MRQRTTAVGDSLEFEHHDPNLTDRTARIAARKTRQGWRHSLACARLSYRVCPLQRAAPRSLRSRWPPFAQPTVLMPHRLRLTRNDTTC